MHEEMDCLAGLPPKAPENDPKEIARLAAIKALQEHRFLDAVDCARVYSILCRGITEGAPPIRVTGYTRWGVSLPFHSRKNAERFAAHVGGYVVD